MKHTRARAEEQFAAIQRQAKRAQTEHEIAQQERAEHIARLRALRLAKEAADRDRARSASAAKTAAEEKK
jgi:hypothetical protein